MQARLLPQRWLTCTFYCLTTWLTFEPEQADVVDRTRMHKKKKKGLDCGTYTCEPAVKQREEQQYYNSHNHHALHVSAERKKKKKHATMASISPRSKCRVHSPPEAFLSLIRGASSCLQPSPAHHHESGPAHKQLISDHFVQLIPPFSLRSINCVHSETVMTGMELELFLEKRR